MLLICQQRNFNSIKVRLKLIIPIMNNRSKINFNSIKVRLKHDKVL